MLSTFDNKTTPAVNPAAINPYFMNTTYRRPTNTPASDLGYSTMTPHGDDTSEQASTTCVESSVVAVVGRDRYRPPAQIPHSTALPAILPPPPAYNRCRRPLLADVDDDVTEPQSSVLTHDVAESLAETALPMQTIVPDASSSLLLPHQFITDAEVHSLDVH